MKKNNLALALLAAFTLSSVAYADDLPVAVASDFEDTEHSTADMYEAESDDFFAPPTVHLNPSVNAIADDIAARTSENLQQEEGGEQNTAVVPPVEQVEGDVRHAEHYEQKDTKPEPTVKPEPKQKPATVASTDIPAAPVNVVSKNVPKPIGAGGGGASTSNLKVNHDSTLVMMPGVNQLVPIAIDHVNRIVTPFERPALHVANEESISHSVKDNVVYLGTAVESPITVFVTEKGDESRAFSLTLIPQRIPPRELFLRFLDGDTYVRKNKTEEAQKWEASQPYVETLRNLFRSVALGEIPSGYSMARYSSQVPYPTCDQIGLRFNFNDGQVLAGHSINVVIGVATNVTGEPIEFMEASCGNWNVAAVAAWPHNVLAPNQKTEIYVAQKNAKQTNGASMRPSLLY